MLTRRRLFAVVMAGPLLLLDAPGSGQAALTNQDIIKMVRAELSPAIIRTTIQSAAVVSFDVSPEALIALKEAGVTDEIIVSMQARAAAAVVPTAIGGPDKSSPLQEARDPETLLRTFRTLTVDAREALFFGNAHLTAALRRQEGFSGLGVTIVDDPSLADAVLKVSYTFAWDYPFKLIHQQTSVVMLSGLGHGAFSGPAGATSVAALLVKQLKPYRTQGGSAPTVKR